MSDTPGIPPELGLRLDAIRRRILSARETLASGNAIDLSELTEEVQAVCEALRAAPLQMDREAVTRDIETILVDLSRLQQELVAQHEAGVLLDDDNDGGDGGGGDGG